MLKEQSSPSLSEISNAVEERKIRVISKKPSPKSIVQNVSSTEELVQKIERENLIVVQQEEKIIQEENSIVVQQEEEIVQPEEKPKAIQQENITIFELDDNESNECNISKGNNYDKLIRNGFLGVETIFDKYLDLYPVGESTTSIQSKIQYKRLDSGNRKKIISQFESQSDDLHEVLKMAKEKDITIDDLKQEIKKGTTLTGIKRKFEENEFELDEESVKRKTMVPCLLLINKNDDHKINLDSPLGFYYVIQLPRYLSSKFDSRKDAQNRDIIQAILLNLDKFNYEFHGDLFLPVIKFALNEFSGFNPCFDSSAIFNVVPIDKKNYIESGDYVALNFNSVPHTHDQIRLVTNYSDFNTLTIKYKMVPCKIDFEVNGLYDFLNKMSTVETKYFEKYNKIFIEMEHQWNPISFTLWLYPVAQKMHVDPKNFIQYLKMKYQIVINI